MTIINNLPEGFKEMENAEIHVKVVIEEWKDELGRINQKTMWRRLDKPVSLGSLKNPKNEEIVGFKIVDTGGGQLDLRNFFGGLFK